MIDKSRRVYIESYGCQMNSYDSRAILDRLVADGYEAVQQPEDAGLLLLNTCAVRDHAETRVLGRIGQLQLHKQRDPQVRLGVAGCMAQRLGDELPRRRRGVDFVVGTDAYDRLPEILERQRTEARSIVDVATDGETIYSATPQLDPINNTHFISVTQGCDYRCTFCIVPSTRGVLRAKHPQAVLAEARAVVRSGGVEVTLLGQNVTAYRHAEASFADLLREVSAIDGIRRVRFLTSHPTDFPNETLRAIAESPGVSPWLHMPLQSGSDRVLRRMKRGYKLSEYMQIVERARALLPDVTFSTDIIVGFPGESEADFVATLSAMDQVRFDSAFMFKYSARPGTPAARLPDDVNESEKEERLHRLMEHQERRWRSLANEQVGRRWQAAIEGPDHKGQGYLKARTLNHRKLLLPDDGMLRRGDEVLVRVVGWRGTTFDASLIGLLWRAHDVAA